MKTKQLRFIDYFLTLALVTALTLVTVSCSSTPSSTSATTSTSNVAPTLSEIAVTPNPPANLIIGSTQQFTAIGIYFDGSSKEITSLVTWTSDTTGVATISSSGLATGLAAGTAKITATLSGVTAVAANLTVVAATTTTSTTSATTTSSTTTTTTTTTSTTSP